MSSTVIRPPRRHRHSHRKVAAVLAGGLVFGIGAMATLAAWNDSEFASATFTSGKFDLEGSLDNGTTYAQHSVTPGSVTFTAPVGNLSPGDVVNAGFPVRLAAGTTRDAKLKVLGIGSSGGMTGLTVMIWQNAVSNDCNATYTPATLMTYFDGTTMSNGIQPTLTKGATTSVAGAPAYVCIKMIADSNLPQGQVATQSWTFTATSH